MFNFSGDVTVNGLLPYYFDMKFFFSALYRSLFDRSKINAKLGFRRMLFLIIFVTVMVIDYGSEKLRHKVIGLEKGPAT